MESTSIINPDGYTCTGCGKHTDKDYDDPNMKIGALCKKCRDDWDRNCKPEIAIINRNEPVKYRKELTIETDSFELLEEYRKSLGLSTHIDPEAQDVAKRFLEEKKYLGEDQGIQWLNGEWAQEKWHGNNISVYLFNGMLAKPYNDFEDLFQRQESKNLICSNKTRFGYSQDEQGSILIQVEKASQSNPYQKPENSSCLL